MANYHHWRACELLDDDRRIVNEFCAAEIAWLARAVTMSAKIGSDHSESIVEMTDYRRPFAAVASETMQQHDLRVAMPNFDSQLD